MRFLWKYPARCGMWLLLLMVLPGIAQAQATRAEQLIALRQHKEQMLRPPPEPSSLERAVTWLEEQGFSPAQAAAGENLPGSERAGGSLIRPLLGGLPDGAGIVVGLAVRPTRGNPHTLLEVQGAVSDRWFWGVDVEAGLQRGPLATYGFARYNHAPRLRFYGLGQDADREDRTHFRVNELMAGGLLGLRPVSPLTLGGHASYLTLDYGAGHTGKAPTVADRFPAVPGLWQDLDYAVYGGFLQLDLRNVRFPFAFGKRFSPTTKDLTGRDANPTAGTYLAVEASRFDDLSDSGFSFDRLEIEAQQYLPFRNRYHVFALRHYTSFTRAADGQQVPFYLLPTLGSSRTLRGFSGFRFRDQHLMLFNLEYRWQVWIRMDAALFLDAGKVFPEVEDWGLNGLEYTGGFGLRFKTPTEVVARVDLAFSREGFYPYLSFSHVF